jgi:acyl-coenzyme A thioesterase PaaI-like protein
MELEQLKEMLSTVVPFNRHIGLEVLEVGAGSASVRLPEAPHLLNHVGTQHASALFSVAEAASGGAVGGALADIITSVTPLARSAQITYLKPARGPITAIARLDEELESLRVELEAQGRADFAVTVDLEDAQGLKVAEMTVAWYVRKNA